MVNSNFLLTGCLREDFQNVREVTFGKMHLGLDQTFHPPRKKSRLREPECGQHACFLEGGAQAGLETPRRSKTSALQLADVKTRPPCFGGACVARPKRLISVTPECSLLGVDNGLDHSSLQSP